MPSFQGLTMFMSGGSRGIGLEIAKRVAADGANVAFIAKTDEPHPSLPGTIHTAAEEIEAAGGRALPIVGDVRNEDDVARAVDLAVERFGRVDLCVNNASAINLAPVESMALKRYDLMQAINVRGTFVVSRACIPHLRESPHGHILTLSPPINLSPSWLGAHAPYTLSKYGMTLLTLGLAAELAPDGIAANCLWPRTLIGTAAVQNLLGGDEAMARTRSPRIVADAARSILRSDPRSVTGRCFIDDEVLAADGVTDLSPYGPESDQPPTLDLFVDEARRFY